MKDLYGVIGNPILHSRSPLLFNTAFRELGMDSLYIRLASRNVEEAVGAARALGLKGFNVTSPFKEAIVPLLDRLDDSAEAAGAVNTVEVAKGGLVGHNTDGYGAATALEESISGLKGRRVLLLGAGGAAKAVSRELALRGAELTIANRTLEKAEKLSGRLNELGDASTHSAVGLDGPEFIRAVKGSRVIVSCVTSLDRIVPRDLLTKDHVVLDANYSRVSTLVEDAIGARCDVVDGMEWLVHQGARGFTILTGKEAPVTAMQTAAYELKKRFRDTSVALIGPMGSGKSSTARELAGRLDAGFVDTDEEVVKSMEMTIADIFKDMGEPAFREAEKRAVHQAFFHQRQVVALGGGAVLDPENVEHIRHSGCVVLLWAPPAFLAKRVKAGMKRPLLEGRDAEEELRLIMGNRHDNYFNTADIVICTGHLSVSETAELIENEVRRTFPNRW